MTIDRKSKPFEEVLAAYKKTWMTGRLAYSGFCAKEEETSVRRFEELLASEEQRCFDNDFFLPGHLTGSAFVLSHDLSRVLLTLHRKLGIWIQLGGHADGQSLLADVAMREAEEESGIKGLRSLDYEAALHLKIPPAMHLPFDVDVHEIPARKEVPPHLHFDVRYLLVAKPDPEIKITVESCDLRWFSLDEARQVTAERSMHCQFDKADFLRKALLK